MACEPIIGEECGDPHALLFGVRRSIRYHNRRRSFFDTLNKLSSFFKVVSGSATITTVLAKMGPTAITISASTVALLSGVDLILQTSQVARLHFDLAKRFNALEREITVAEAGKISKAMLAGFCARDSKSKLTNRRSVATWIRFVTTSCAKQWALQKITSSL